MQVSIGDEGDVKSKVFSEVIVSPILDDSFVVPIMRGQYRFLLYRIF